MENQANTKLNALNVVHLESKLDLFIYVNSKNALGLSLFSKYQTNNNNLIEPIKEFNFNQIAKKITCFNNETFIISLEKEVSDQITIIKSSLLIYQKNGSFEDLVMLEDKISRVNSIKIFQRSPPTDLHETKYFVAICCEYHDEKAKGCLIIFEIVYKYRNNFTCRFQKKIMQSL